MDNQKTPEAGERSAPPAGSPLQFLYTVPDPCPRDIQAMSVWSQEMNRVAETVTPRELRAAFEWFKSWGESKIKELEANSPLCVKTEDGR